MLLRFAELGSETDSDQRDQLAVRAARIWARLIRELEEGQTVCVFDSRIEVSLGGGHFVVREVGPSARPLSELFIRAAPTELPVQWGLSPQEHATALAHVLSRTGLNLERARVRVGFTRGHLMDVVVSIPLDVEGSAEQLQVAAELYLEHRLGDHLVDTWVNSVAVDRIARTKGLLMAKDSRASAESHALEVAKTLVHRGATGVRAGLPKRLVDLALKPESWTALEIPESRSGMQRDRLFASTCFPEALKCALEGMPFDSTRFTRGGELFLWARWRAGDRDQREPLRVAVEQFFRAKFATVLVGGTGFGSSHDYLDFWAPPDCALLREIAVGLAALCEQIELGFYDSYLCEERLCYRSGRAENELKGASRATAVGPSGACNPAGD